MAEVFVMRHLVKPNGFEDSPFVDSHHFLLEVNRRDKVVPGATGEWSVSEFGFTGYGFTKTGERVSLRGHDEPNRHLAVFPEAEALLLARDIVDGKVEAVGFTPLAVAAAAFRARQQEASDA